MESDPSRPAATHKKPSELASDPGAILTCGWGRLIFGHTFPDPSSVARTILDEQPGQRDIAFYINDPQLILNSSPQELFLDPSTTYRLHKDNHPAKPKPTPGIDISTLRRKDDIEAINRIYAKLDMVPVDPAHLWARRSSERYRYFLARNNTSGRILGVAMGVDHTRCFADLQNSCSLWALGVDPQADLPGVGASLTRHIADYYFSRGRDFLDLSVMHNNAGAIGLYRKLGFEKVAVFAIKRRNSINEKLFVGSPPERDFNPYATIIIKEALRRGIAVDPIDPPRGFFRLSLAGRSVVCRESLSEMTSAIALQRCDDKELTLSILAKAGLPVPDQITVTDTRDAIPFLEKHPRIVVKPARGEQGRAVFVDITTRKELAAAIAAAGADGSPVLVEKFVEGDDLRIIVINGEMVAAAIRKPAEITGTGHHTVAELIEMLSRRRGAATGGESSIPMDSETTRCLRSQGFSPEDLLPEGRTLRVRKTANLHTGGTIHDVTDQLHPDLAASAVAAARALAIPVVGLDLLVPSVDQPEHTFIEANERPGLANHEPQPTAPKFIDFLFPQTIPARMEPTDQPA
jgi:GNAT-family acetyltransferase (TIGR03103 family)